MLLRKIIADCVKESVNQIQMFRILMQRCRPKEYQINEKQLFGAKDLPQVHFYAH